MSKPSKKPYADLFPPLPIGAATDPELMEQLHTLTEQLPESLPTLRAQLKDVEMYHTFDVAMRFVSLAIARQLNACIYASEAVQKALLDYALDYFPVELCIPICRQLSKHPHSTIRTKARVLAERKHPTDVALPSQPEGDWNFEGWRRGIERGKLLRHLTGHRTLKAHALPVLNNVGELCTFLGIRSPSQLGFLLLSSEMEDESGPYVKFTIPKRTGKPRTICAPKDGLKRIQRKILKDIVSLLPTHDAAHGFVDGRSTVTNAAVHQGRKILVKFDIHEFFPTVHFYRTMGLFAQMGYPIQSGLVETNPDSEEVAPVLARLTTYVPPNGKWSAGHLPQGAPTSPAIANLICRNLDARLEGLAKSIQGRYTRYADDLTFSFDEEPQPSLGRFRWWVDQICQQEGFYLNQHKFRVVRSSQRQMVTGIVVNETLRIPRKERRRFRAILHNCEVHGIASQAKGNPRFKSYLQGFASYIHMVHPEEGKMYMRKVKELLERSSQEAPHVNPTD